MNLGAHLDPLLDRPSEKLVAAYYGPSNNFAGITFDLLGRASAAVDPMEKRNRFTSEDLLAVTLLDVRWKAPAVRHLLDQPDRRMVEALSVVPDCDVWAEGVGDEEFDAADRLYAALCTLPGVKRTKATKLMARKRPRFVPIVDSIILGSFHLPRSRWRFQLWREALLDPERRARVEALRPPRVDVPLLRLVDVVVWMRCSRSRDAARERAAVGLQ